MILSNVPNVKRLEFMKVQNKILILTLLVLPLFSPDLLAATKDNKITLGYQDQIFSSQNRYQPYFELGGIKYFNQASNVSEIYDLFIPLYQQQNNQLFFTDLRIFDRSGSSFEGNAHFGYRKLYLDTKQMFGIYGAFDRKRSDKENLFNQITLGIEYWYDNWFVGGNIYKPIGQTKKLAKSEFEIDEQTDRAISATKYYEKSLPGLYAELGYAFTDNFTGYVGGYCFHANDANTTAGPKIRLTYDYNQPYGRILGILDGISIEAGAQHDKPRGNTAYVGIRFKVGLTNLSKNSNVFGFERHIVELVRRDPDIVVGNIKPERIELANKQGYILPENDEKQSEFTDEDSTDDHDRANNQKDESTSDDSDEKYFETLKRIKPLSEWSVKELTEYKERFSKKLGLSKDLSGKEAHKLWREFARENHPDKNANKYVNKHDRHEADDFYRRRTQISLILEEVTNELQTKSKQIIFNRNNVPTSRPQESTQQTYEQAAFNVNTQLTVYPGKQPESFYNNAASQIEINEKSDHNILENLKDSGNEQKIPNKNLKTNTISNGGGTIATSKKILTSTTNQGGNKPIIQFTVTSYTLNNLAPESFSGNFLNRSLLNFSHPLVFQEEKYIKPEIISGQILYIESSKSVAFKKGLQDILSKNPLFFVVEQKGVNIPVFLRRDDLKAHPYFSDIESNWKENKEFEGNVFSGEMVGFSSVLFLEDGCLNITGQAIEAVTWLEEKLKEDKRNYFGAEVKCIVPFFLSGWNYGRTKTHLLESDDEYGLAVDRTKSTNNVRNINNVNLAYEYEGQDMYDLLYLRAKEANFDLAKTVLMPPLILSSMCSQAYLMDELKRNLRELLGKKPFAEMVLIPFNLCNLHWIGLIAYLDTKGQIKNIDYINSLRAAVPDEIESILKNIDGGNVSTKNLRGLMQKTKDAGCGPLAIENLIQAVGGNLKLQDVEEKELKTIRYHHIELLERFKSEKQFYFRQRWGMHSFEYITTNNTKLEGWLIIDSNQLRQPFLLKQRGMVSFFEMSMHGSGEGQTDVISTSKAVKQYFQIAVPSSLAELISVAGNYLNSIFLSNLDKNALAASSLILTMQTIVYLGSEIPHAANILIPRAVGKKRYDDVGKIIRQSMLLAGIIAIPEMAIGFLSGSILNILGQTDNISKIVQQYFVGYTLGIPARLGMGIVDQLAIGVSRPNLVLMRTAIYSILTPSLGYGLIFGEFGIPKLGIAGLGYADSLASWLTLGAMTTYLWTTNSFYQYGLFINEWRGSSHILNNLVRNGLPIAVQTSFLVAGYSWLSIMKGWLGEESLLSQQIVFQTVTLFYCIEGSISQAATALVGRALGDGSVESVRKLGRIGLFLGTTVAILGEALFIVVPNLFTSVFISTNDPENLPVMNLTKTLFFTEGLILISESLFDVSQGALRGLEVTKIGAIASLVKVGIFSALGFSFYFTLNWGLISLSCAELAGSSAAAFISLISWFRR